MLAICDILGCTPKEFYGFFIFFGVGLFGMVAHWAKKWLREEITSSLFRYLFISKARYTAMSILTYFGAMATVVAVGNIEFANPQSIALSFLAGYTIDSAINQDYTNVT